MACRPQLSVRASGSVFDFCAHPKLNIVAAGTVDGNIELFSVDIAAKKSRLRYCKKLYDCSIRTLSFSSNLADLYVGSANGNIDILDAEAGGVKTSWAKAHGDAVSCLVQVNESFLVTGDDSGYLKLWDVRQAAAICKEKLNADYISDMVACGNLLLTTSGDGKLTVFDTKQNKIAAQSDDIEEPLTSLVILKNRQKVVVGTESGVLGIFSWGHWGDISDRLPGHEDAITCMLKFDEDVLFTGSDDGWIRAVGIQPHGFLACEGRHGALGVTALKWFRRPHCVCSSSAMESTRLNFWDAAALLTDSAGPQEDSDDDSDASEHDAAAVAPRAEDAKGAPAKRRRHSDNGQKAKHRKRNAGKQSKSNKRNETFFSDL